MQATFAFCMLCFKNNIHEIQSLMVTPENEDIIHVHIMPNSRHGVFVFNINFDRLYLCHAWFSHGFWHLVFLIK